MAQKDGATQPVKQSKPAGTTGTKRTGTGTSTTTGGSKSSSNSKEKQAVAPRVEKGAGAAVVVGTAVQLASWISKPENQEMVTNTAKGIKRFAGSVWPGRGENKEPGQESPSHLAGQCAMAKRLGREASAEARSRLGDAEWDRQSIAQIRAQGQAKLKEHLEALTPGDREAVMSAFDVGYWHGSEATVGADDVIDAEGIDPRVTNDR